MHLAHAGCNWRSKNDASGSPQCMLCYVRLRPGKRSGVQEGACSMRRPVTDRPGSFSPLHTQLPVPLLLGMPMTDAGSCRLAKVARETALHP
eukprot:355184-Chlamydomonas_euryale.AAC.5